MSIKRTAPNYTTRTAAVLKAWLGSARGPKKHRLPELLAGPQRIEVSEHLGDLAEHLPPPQAHNNPQPGSQGGKL